MIEKRIILAGMPNSGKSTFIAALRHLIISQEAESELVENGLSQNEAHLNRLHDKWINRERVERTQVPSEAWVTIHVKDVSTGVEAELSIPDLKGERFEQPAAAGLCQRTLYEALLASDGLILFTNADTSPDDLMITDMDDLDDEPFAEAAEDGGDENAVPFKPYEMPEEAKIVELLQMMNRSPATATLRKLALIISGWDAAEEAGATSPAAWFSLNRPMLSQYLEYNSEHWETRVYGVSAQGGSLPRDAERLAKILKQAERARIIGHKAGEHDLTAPVRWIMTAGT